MHKLQKGEPMPVLNNKHVSDLEQVMMMIDDVDADLRNDYKTNRTALMYLNEIQNRLNEIHKSIQNKRSIHGFTIRQH